jgi:two-component system LytT family response regulator
MIRLAIIEDEQKSRVLLRKLLEEAYPDIKIVGEAGDITEAITLLNSTYPDIVMMDVHLNADTIEDVLDRIEFVDFKIIFLTGDVNFAHKGFQYNATDFVLKPFDIDKIKIAINKAKTSLELENKVMLATLKDNLQHDQDEKISIGNQSGIHLVAVHEIEYLISSGPYTEFVLVNGNKIMVSKSFKEYESFFTAKGFYRVHRSYIINLKYLTKFTKEGNGEVKLRSGVELPVASRRREALVNLLHDFAS